MKVYFYEIWWMIWLCYVKRNLVKLQDIIEKYGLNYKSKHRKTYNFGKYYLSIVFLRDIHEEYAENASIIQNAALRCLWPALENADHKQSNFAIELMNFEKGTKTLGKKCIFKIIYDFYLV